MKNSNPPTHAAIAQRAQEIWTLRGNPDGHDTAIWHEAERQLTAVAPESESPVGSITVSPAPVKNKAEPVVARTSPAPLPAKHLPAPDPVEIAAKSALQKKSARTPQLPTHKVTKQEIPETGKPLWDKPHSS